MSIEYIIFSDSESDKIYDLDPDNINVVIDYLRDPSTGVGLHTRKFKNIKYKKCFSGRDLIDWIVDHVRGINTRSDALDLAVEMESLGVFTHVNEDHPIEDRNWLYKFLNNGGTKRSVVVNSMYEPWEENYHRYDVLEQANSSSNFYASIGYSIDDQDLNYSTEIEKFPSSESDFTDSDSFDISGILELDEDILYHVIKDSIYKIGATQFATQVINESYLSLGSMIKDSLIQCWKKTNNEIKNYTTKLKQMDDTSRTLKSEESSERNFPLHRYLEYQWIDQFSACEGLDQYARLNNSYKDTVEKLGKVIILEKNLPNFKKSIVPSLVGGFAGGIKYIVYGILFKFAQDSLNGRASWLYGGRKADHHLAGKALNNDLKALRALMVHRDSFPRNLSIPIMSTISYLGYVVCAISLLPLEENSLCYGTPDSGQTYADDTDIDPNLKNIVNSIAKKFHFAPHDVQDTNGNTHTVQFAADVEIHRNKDVYYILDLGRFFPPNNERNPFLHLFRAEYLVNLDKHTTISCDSFSGFGRIDSSTHNSFAREIIDDYFSYIKSSFRFIEIQSFVPRQLKSKLHQRGINIRHIGYIRQLYIQEKIKTEKQLVQLRSKTERKRKSGDRPANISTSLRYSRSFDRGLPMKRSSLSLSHSGLKLSLKKERSSVSKREKRLSSNKFRFISSSKNILSEENEPQPSLKKTRSLRISRNSTGEEEQDIPSSIKPEILYEKSITQLELNLETANKQIDFILMEMILRSCKTILNKNQRKIAETHVIPNLDIIDEMTLRFHSDILDKNSAFWTSRKLKKTIENKFNPNLELTDGENILNLFSLKENISTLIDMVPLYCNYKGGRFLFEVETLLRSKSSIPEMDAKYVIDKLMENNEPELFFKYWNEYRELGLTPDILLPLAIPCSQFREDNSEFLNCIYSQPKLNSDSINFLVNSSAQFYYRNVEIKRNKEILNFIYDKITTVIFDNIVTEQIRSLKLLSNLVMLDISGSSQIRDTGLISICKHLTQLILLNIKDCIRLSDKGVTSFQNLAVLETLNISGCHQITEDGLMLLFVSLPNKFDLKCIDLSETSITDYCLEYVCRNYLSILELNISKCYGLTDMSYEYLANHPSIQTLNISYCHNFTVDGIELLSHGRLINPSAGFVNVTSLNLAGTATTGETLGNLNSITTYLNISSCFYVENLNFLNPWIEDLMIKNLSLKNCLSLSMGELRKISSLKNLEILDLSHINTIPVLELDFLQGLPITHLYLEGTNIINDSITGPCVDLKLQVLNIAYCRLLTDSALFGIALMTDLVDLDISGCSIYSENSFSVFEEIFPKRLKMRNIRNLGSIDPFLDMNSLKSLDLIGSPIPKMSLRNFKDFKKLEEISFSCHTFTDEFLPSDFPYLQKFNLENSNITNNELEIIVLRSPNIRVFNLTNCPFIDDDSVHLIIEYFPHLVELRLTKCSLITDFGINILSTRNNLSVLHISHLKRVTYPRKISSLSNLKELDASHCDGISEEFCQKIATLKSLDTLNLCHCKSLNDSCFLEIQVLYCLTDLVLFNYH
eukprot:TRINITY_DN3489_c0_g1_i2.p1 TRINITY_DN3489_c0_g1~~TRINITY_DN3489_c0_g1_i2.p1  ORF type:complete len:1545 (+),score=233.43 TRINITY_DN3489_c0_g1_i2:53-4687(+)